jgi:hypothetical protein
MKHLNKILADSEAMHSQVVVELEEEKAKNLSTKGKPSLKWFEDMLRKLNLVEYHILPCFVSRWY